MYTFDGSLHIIERCWQSTASPRPNHNSCFVPDVRLDGTLQKRKDANPAMGDSRWKKSMQLPVIGAFQQTLTSVFSSSLQRRMPSGQPFPMYMFLCSKIKTS
ncbi:polyketide synthase, putative [Pseudozyma hubeiensis SY62]|uniref:Polyketide synthase, putative n=1 Tax=Pseudozyma hubeiensis (strain SY62) TaxID=1305764 RepID=R9NX51_PSEHS|nr:polyketide synthase, putative [Pseudozyma hubeiensis SY62]GAC93102.1 polyketide synthase, putative [Pseudozyma hubeiensis SY62]